MKLIKLLKKIKSYEWVGIYDENYQIITEGFAIKLVAKFDDSDEISKMNSVYTSKVVDFSTDVDANNRNAYIVVVVDYKGDM